MLACGWLSLCLAHGCARVGLVYSMPLVRTDLPPGEPLVGTVPVSKAFFTVDDEERLVLAMRHQKKSLISDALETDWVASAILEGVPAGTQRLYKLRQAELQVVQRHGGMHQRGRSFSGIFVIEDYDEQQLSGRFHTWIRSQSFTLLEGWSPEIYRGPIHILAGEFRATRDADAVQRLKAMTEEDGFERPLGTRPTVRVIPPPDRRRPTATAPAE
jgi:hypothetical protein